MFFPDLFARKVMTNHLNEYKYSTEGFRDKPKAIFLILMYLVQCLYLHNRTFACLWETSSFQSYAFLYLRLKIIV